MLQYTREIYIELLYWTRSQLSDDPNNISIWNIREQRALFQSLKIPSTPLQWVYTTSENLSQTPKQNWAPYCGTKSDRYLWGRLFSVHSFHFNGHTFRFQPQTQKLEPVMYNEINSTTGKYYSVQLSFEWSRFIFLRFHPQTYSLERDWVTLINETARQKSIVQ